MDQAREHVQQRIANLLADIDALRDEVAAIASEVDSLGANDSDTARPRRCTTDQLAHYLVADGAAGNTEEARRVIRAMSLEPEADEFVDFTTNPPKWYTKQAIGTAHAINTMKDLDPEPQQRTPAPPNTSYPPQSNATHDSDGSWNTTSVGP